jgi:alginate O-acetyltransferase complex protein AlgJ
LIGHDGWMFFRGDNMVRQSAGIVRRDAQVAQTVDLLATMHTALAARGIRTEYDVFLRDLAAAGIQAVDLRPVLRAAKAEEKIYLKHDTHWTPRGALVAFNAIVQADSHPDWKLDPAAMFGPPATIVGGDLARILGIDADVTEREEPLVISQGKRETFHPNDPFSGYVQTGDRTGPTIMIIGDSFTETYFAPFLLQNTGPVVWLHHRFCRFDWKWVDQFHPDEIWWMPTERYLLCDHGVRPVGMPPQGTAGR